MATLTFSHTLANGNTADADQVMANFNNVKTLVETTKLDVVNLSNPNSLLKLDGKLEGQLASGGNQIIRRDQTPAGVILVPVLATVAFESGSDGDVRVKFEVTDDTAQVITGGVTAAVGTLAPTTSFAIESIAAGSAVTFKVTETSSAGTADDITVSLWCKTEHME